MFLGFDCSTQGLTALVLGSDLTPVFERTLEFDVALPRYGTRHGVLPSDDPHVAEAPPAMWAEALELLMADLAASGLDLSAIRAISGSAQQHGSVYLAADGTPTRPRSPIWMDSSTSRECDEITRAVGGPRALAELTGSRAFERFTGPQIRRFARTQPDAFARTARIHLVSSFMASLLVGGDAPVEPADASGMNLMDIRTREWSPVALDATAPDLAGKLPLIRDSWSVAGSLAPRWQRRGWPAADVIAWSGDNPTSLVGAGAVREGQAVISLGTSDTIFAWMASPRLDPSLGSHVFAAPNGGFMGLTCFQNGSLARERVRDAYGLDWNGFSSALLATEPGNRGGLMFPWFEPEITPRVPGGDALRFDLDPGDAAANVRAVVEGQMMAIARHSRWMGDRLDRVRVTGGAAVNADILQVMADVLGVTVEVTRIDAAAFGAALRAWHGCATAHGAPLSWDDVAAVARNAARGVRPRPAYRETYDTLMRKAAAIERTIAP